MKRQILLGAATAVLGLSALTGCGGSNTGSTGTTSTGTSAPSTQGTESGSSSAAADLTTGSTSLGTVVVDGKGMTIYVFDKDTANSGKSVCYSECAAAWPAVTTKSATPSVNGVTGKLGTITRTDGTHQVTINGMPVYTFRQDAAAGDVTGQGFGGIWWVVKPDGAKDTSTSSPSSSPSSVGGY